MPDGDPAKRGSSCVSSLLGEEASAAVQPEVGTPYVRSDGEVTVALRTHSTPGS